MMNLMTDMWSTFGADQGQIVEVSYRYHCDSERIICREHDRSDGRTTYAAAPCPDDVEWNGSEAVAPWYGTLDWEPCDDPWG